MWKAKCMCISMVMENDFSSANHSQHQGRRWWKTILVCPCMFQLSSRVPVYLCSSAHSAFLPSCQSSWPIMTSGSILDAETPVCSECFAISYSCGRFEPYKKIFDKKIWLLASLISLADSRAILPFSGSY